LSEPFALNQIRKTDPQKIQEDYDNSLFNTKRKLTRIDTMSGQQRGYQWLNFCQWMQKAEAFAIGDIEEIQEMLFNIEFIGKQGRNGYGAIRDITVEPCPDAEQKWQLRVLPETFLPTIKGVDFAPAMHCLKPPYWQKMNRVVAMEPII
jgi:CRISPR type IV-associated protein Csf3